MSQAQKISSPNRACTSDPHNPESARTIVRVSNDFVQMIRKNSTLFWRSSGTTFLFLNEETLFSTVSHLPIVGTLHAQDKTSEGRRGFHSDAGWNNFGKGDSHAACIYAAFKFCYCSLGGDMPSKKKYKYFCF